jgi:HEAT repeats
MSDCDVMRESMPLLLTESLDPVRRELTHQHIESCEVCSDEWAATKDTWLLMGDLPEVEVPARVKARFLEAAGIQERPANVIPFHRKPAFRYVAQAAAVAVLVGGAWFGGQRTATPVYRGAPAMVERVPATSPIVPISLSESRVIDASALSPTIEGRPDISNIHFAENEPHGDIAVSFDVTSHWTVKGNPRDKSMLRLVSYVLENQAPNSTAIESVRRVYANAGASDPAIAGSLAKLLRNEENAHAGVRIQAVDTLKTFAPSLAAESQEALIDALKNDPNPSVRIKAIEALTKMARGGATLDAATLETLSRKSFEENENTYIRLKAAEALKVAKP